MLCFSKKKSCSSFAIAFSILLSLSLSLSFSYLLTFSQVSTLIISHSGEFFARALCQIFNLSVKIVFECEVDNSHFINKVN